MTFEQAIRKAMKSYWKENSEVLGMQSFKDKKFNKNYFDSVETEFLNKSEKEDKRFIK